MAPPTSSNTASASRRDDGEIKSAKRVLDLFQLFAERRRALTVGDVVAGLDCPQSSMSVLLRSLTQMGWLDYDRRTRRYMPTLRVALLGGWVHDELFSETSLSRLMDELHMASGGTVILGIQNEIFVQYIHLAQGLEPPLLWYLKPGTLRPLYRTAAGKILLSLKSDVDAMYLLRRANAEEADPARRVRESDLLRELDEIRRLGYAITYGAVTTNAGMVAMQMPTPTSQPPMAIAIGAPLPTLHRDRDRFLSLMTEALGPYRAKSSLVTKADPLRG